MRVKLILAGVVVLLISASMAADSDDRYGAIAYGRHSGRYGYATERHSRRAAEELALRNCDSRDCEIKVWFRNSSGALAVGHDRITGWSYSTGRRDARERAMDNCRRNTRDCRIVIETCSR
jgi:hypothetical protein